MATEIAPTTAAEHGALRRYDERAAQVARLRHELAEAEVRLERAVHELGSDPLGRLPLWSAGRE